MKAMRSFFLILLLLADASRVVAQGTAFFYQGRLTDGGADANGAYDMSFTLFTASANGTPSGSTVTNSIAVSNGVFTATLDFGPGVFDGTALWLEVGVRTNGAPSFTALPRQKLLPVPYAIYAPSAGTAGSVNSGVIQSNSIANGQVVRSIDGLTDNVKIAAGANITLASNVQTSTLTISAVNSGGGAGTNNQWNLLGNANTATPPNFVGTTDNTPLEMHVNNVRALLLQPQPGGPNVIGGAPNNTVAGFAETIAGGLGNTIQGASANLIGGGSANLIESGVSNSVIGGGWQNDIQEDLSAIVGGGANTNVGVASLIGGGLNNTIQVNASYCCIVGGLGNNIKFNAFGSSIGGGYSNNIGDTVAGVIAGGRHNSASDFANYSAIAGGDGNTVNGDGFGPADQFIGGGESNNIGPGGVWAVVGGGFGNMADSTSCVIGGGGSNVIGADCAFSGILAGSENVVANQSLSSAISGGANNSINGAFDCAIGGGWSNSIAVDNFYGSSVISGGRSNAITGGAMVSTIGGGMNNTVNNAMFATIPGGSNNIAVGDYSFAAGRNASALHEGCFVWSDSRRGGVASTGANQFIINAEGGVCINAKPADVSLTVTNGAVIDTITAGTITASGNILSVKGNISAPFGDICGLTMCGVSDRNAKQGFAPVDARATLDKVAALPISTWSFKANPGTRHLGPMAQDFYAAFSVGADDKHIATVDEEGAALAAIQGLNQELKEEISAKDAKIESLEQRLVRLEHLVASIEETPHSAP